MAPVRYNNRNTVYDFVHDEGDENGLLTIAKEHAVKSKYPEFLPTWSSKEKYEPLTFFKHIDPGSRADPEFPNLFAAGAKVHITPKFGTEIHGVQLSQLNDAAKDELALFVAQRGVVAFRDQDFNTKGPGFATEYGRYFGRLHIHPTSGAPKGHPEVHVVYRRPETADLFASRTNLIGWHSDVSYELQPPGITLFSVLEAPDAGGDTLFADTEEAYNRLSPAFKERLEGLHVLHSGVQQANFSKSQGGVVKRHPVENVHPLVRTHPVTGKKSLYVNSGFSRSIVELKNEESDALLGFLYNHIGSLHDLQARVVWRPNTVVLWDNRRTSHTAVLDWETSELRLAWRVTPQAEKPIDDLKDLNKPGENNVYHGHDYAE